ncbi:MAG: TraR/DksA family transcriptional regulator [Ilumatobacteraceae bacterium]
MPTLFAPSTLGELAGLLERRRESSVQLAASLRTDATYALEDRDLSDLLDSDAPDGGSNDADRAHALALARLAADTATAADDALARLAAGTYGTCESCGDRIPLARLRALPEAPACFVCATRRGRILAAVG